MIRSTVEMYDHCREVNGWAFWTWKKAPTNFPGLVTISVPDDWKGVMDWIGSLFGGQKPDADKAKAGMAAFIEAVKFKNADYNVRMEEALLSKR